MRLIRTNTLAGALACVCLLATAAAPRRIVQEKSPPPKYKIFCVGGEVEIEDKTLGEMREDEEDEEVCELTKDEFENLYEARDAAKKRFGGAGAPCECGS